MPLPSIPPSAPGVTYSLDSNGRPTGIQGPGGIATKFPTACKATVTLCGDSTMAYGDNVGAGGTGIGETSQSHVAWAGGTLRGTPFRVIANRGVGGTLIDFGSNSLLLVQLPLALVDASDILWVRSGINHLNPSIDNNAPTVAQIVDKFRRFLDIAASAKPCVIIDSLNPLNGSVTTPSGAYPRHTDIPFVNAQLQALCATYRNVIYNDTYDAIAADQNGNAIAGMVSSVDGIHQQTAGAYAMGVRSAANIYPQLTLAAGYRVAKTVALPDFTGSGGISTAGSGTVTGTISANMNVVNAAGTSNVTCSVVNHGMQLVIDNSASGAVGTVQVKLSSATAYLGTFANGDIVTAYGRFQVTNGGALNRSNLTFQLNPSGTSVNIDALSKSTQENGTPPTVFPTANYDVTLNTRPFALTAAPASINIAATMEVQAGKIVTVILSGWGLNALTAI